MNFQNNHHQTGSNNIDSEETINHEHNEKPLPTNEESGNSNANDENVNNKNDDETNDNHIVELVDNEGTMPYNVESFPNDSVPPDVEAHQNENTYNDGSQIDIAEIGKSSDKKDQTVEREPDEENKVQAEEKEEEEEEEYENRDSKSQTPKEMEETESKQENHNSDEVNENYDGEKHEDVYNVASNGRPNEIVESNENDNSKNDKEETKDNVDILVIDQDNENEVQMGIRKSVCHKVFFF